MPEAVQAASAPEKIAFGGGVGFPGQAQVVDVHSLPMGFNAPSALHLRDVRRGVCAGGGVFLEGSNAFVDGFYGFVHFASSLFEACDDPFLVHRLALLCKDSFNSSSLALVLLYL